jgi:hypothetical protein
MGLNANMAVATRIKGPKFEIHFTEQSWKALIKNLSKLDKMLATEVAIKGMMAGAMVSLEAAKAGVPVLSGNLRDSLQVVPLRKRGYVGARVIAKRGKKYPGGYYAHLIEYGHNIYRTTRGRWHRKYFIKHYSGHAYMKPALYNNKEECLEAIRREAAAALGTINYE